MTDRNPSRKPQANRNQKKRRREPQTKATK
jgi:hypothetical protein